MQSISDQGKAQTEFEASVVTAQETPTNQANQTNSVADQSTQQVVPVAPQGVKVGEQEYTSDQLTELVNKGKTVKEWEQSKPGYNLDSLYADYTRKSQKLAELERNQGEPESGSESVLAPGEQEMLNKVVNPIIEQAFQKERDQQALNLFKKSHPEYQESSNWTRFIGFFNSYYKLPTAVEAQLQVMEMAHQNMNFEAEVKKKALQEKGQTLANIQKLDMASVGGGGQKSEPNPLDLYTPEQVKYLKSFGLVK